jgi:ATP-dependent Clp protease ATP-binding subunit ClpA
MNNDNIEVLNLDEPKTPDSYIKEGQTVEFSVLNTYGEDMTAKTYITDPAIARDEEIKKLIIILLTPEKSGLLIGKAGIGKTAIVEGLAYRIINNQVPDALKGYRVIKFNSTSLVGTVMVNGKNELVMGLLVQELKRVNKTIIFIDEIHTLIGHGESMDLANMLKAGLDRGDIKAIGATTTAEYNAFIVRDRAFLRRFEKIEVPEPDRDTTVKILQGTLPKIEKQTGAHSKYSTYITQLLLESVVDATSEYKRVYGLAAMYPDVAFSILQQAYSNAIYDNRHEVTYADYYNAIKNSKRIYPDSIVKELAAFREKFKKQLEEEGTILPVVTIDQIDKSETDI